MRLLIMAGLGLAVGCAGLVVAQAVDVQDESDVLNAFSRHVDGDVDPDDICIVTDEQFPDMALVGWFAYDRGCAGDVILVDGDWLDPSAASQTALDKVGWAEADEDRRAALALAWTEFAIFPFRRPVGAGNEDFARDDTPDFVPQSTEPDGTGGVVATMWVGEPSGMLPESEYKLWQLTYDRDGALVRIRVLDSFTVQY